MCDEFVFVILQLNMKRAAAQARAADVGTGGSAVCSFIAPLFSFDFSSECSREVSNEELSMAKASAGMMSAAWATATFAPEHSRDGYSVPVAAFPLPHPLKAGQQEMIAKLALHRIWLIGDDFASC